MENNKMTVTEQVVEIGTFALIAIIGGSIGIPSPILLIFAILIVLIEQAWFTNNEKKKDLEAGVIIVTKEKKESIFHRQKREYEDNLDKRKPDIKKRYMSDSELTSYFLGISKAFVSNNITEGTKMQNETVSKQDWAIAGGMASGIAGPAAGISTAIDVMKKNEEATKKHHQHGEKMVKQGIEALNALEEAENKFNSTKNEANSEKFNYTKLDKNLINKIEIRLKDVKNYGTGYLDITIVPRATDDELLFPGSKRKAKIDGSVCINLFDKSGTNRLATGYYIAPGRIGNDKTLTGFNFLGKRQVVVLKVLPHAKIDKRNGFSITLSEPNLWLLEL